MNDSSIIGQLYQRKMFRIGAGYLAVAWLLWQVVANTCPTFDCSNESQRTIFWLLLGGLPVTLAVAWVNWKTAIIVGVAFIAGAGVAVMVTGSQPIPVVPIVEEVERERLPNSVAVLPLENLSIDTENAFFAAGIHEEILNQLVKLSNLNVISRTSMVRYADSDLSIPEIAAELNVGAVMEGSVRYADDRVLVTLQLIDPETDAHLWSESYNREFADIFAIQADIAMNVANALHVEFSLEEQAKIEAVPTDSPEAYRYYLVALDLNSATEYDQRLEYLRLAIEADREFAEAYAHRGSLHITSLNRALVSEADFESVLAERESLALEDIERALELDPNLAFAYVAKGWIHMVNWRGTEAKEAFERGYELNPNDLDVLNWYSLFSTLVGNLELAVELSERQYELNPAEMGEALGRVLWASGEIEQSVTVFNKSLLANPRQIDSSRYLAVYEFENGNSAEAKTYLDIVAPEVISIGNLPRIADLAYQYRLMGFTEESENLMDIFDERASINRVAATGRIYENLARGDEVQALYWLEQFVELKEPYQGFVPIVNLAQNTFHYPVLNKPEFAALREQLGFTDL